MTEEVDTRRYFNESDPEFLEAQATLQEHGILPGPDGYTSDQLVAEISRRGWGWKLNVDDPTDQPGDFVEIERRWVSPHSETIQKSWKTRAWGSSPAVALTMTLASALSDWTA